MNVVFSAGEASGDRYGSMLLKHIRALGHGLDLRFYAIGGPLLTAEGAQILADSSNWGAIGVTEAVKVGIRTAAGRKRARSQFMGLEPGLFVPIDFGYVNIRLAKLAKKVGWTVLYFIPPGSWRRDRQGADIPAITDAVVAPFDWSAKTLTEMGANARFLGHPLKQLVKEGRQGTPVGVREGVVVMPGSRSHELAFNLPVIAETMRPWNIPAWFSLAPTVNKTSFELGWRAMMPRRSDRFSQGSAYPALLASRVGLICSGTATLEAALCKCPLVTLYRASRLLEMQARLSHLPNGMIALPNILLQRRAVPEFAGAKLNPDDIRNSLKELELEGPMREEQLAAFDELSELLGPDNAISETAAWAIDLLKARDRS